ncbi:6336_t:CDS:2 [Diversispora eburnea]|uniref:6336_t:CDS:1 n=1 Tax=Diversispora eburnea TaxID=1213867 RepID=A0A9N9CNS1_9GLOM|nr:6336_t:CDS:2 [Diversispora eburnea]
MRLLKKKDDEDIVIKHMICEGIDESPKLTFRPYEECEYSEQILTTNKTYREEQNLIYCAITTNIQENKLQKVTNKEIIKKGDNWKFDEKIVKLDNNTSSNLQRTKIKLHNVLGEAYIKVEGAGGWDKLRTEL